MALRPLALADADVRYDASAIGPARAAALFDVLRAEIPWQQQGVHLFGRRVDMPRLTAWIGDADAAYTYSRTRFVPQPWSATLAALRDELQGLTGGRFNSVLANLYRDGRDSVAWHSDDEAELGAQPLIASLSFGAVRRFRLRHRHLAQARPFVIDMAPGSLLVMAGDTQRNYRHDVPKTTRAVGARINLTFRQILIGER